MPSTLQDIRNKVRRMTGRPSASSLTDSEIDAYVNTFYIYDMPEHLRLQNLRVNYQFLTQANIAVYDFPKELYLTAMPPVYIAGYQTMMTQSREMFFRYAPEVNMLQTSVATGTGLPTTYNFTLTSVPVLPGFKRNPPGAYDIATDIPASTLNWNVLISGTNGAGVSVSLIDDGQGNFFDPADPDLTAPRGTINYITGVCSVTFSDDIGLGNPINAQAFPYSASRPRSIVFYQDQFALYPIPDQAYTVSLEAYMYPTALALATDSPQLAEWWQLLAYGAADKVFADNADFENMSKFRPLLDEQMRLCLRRTLVQAASERVSTIYDQSSSPAQFPAWGMFPF